MNRKAVLSAFVVTLLAIASAPGQTGPGGVPGPGRPGGPGSAAGKAKGGIAGGFALPGAAWEYKTYTRVALNALAKKTGADPSAGGPGGAGDPGRIFDMLSKGRGYFLAEDLRQLREPMTQWLEKRDIKDGKVTRELFMSFQKEFRPGSAGTTDILGEGLNKTDILAEGLNKLGAEGWELVAIDSSSKTANPVYVFKRPAGRGRMLPKKDGDPAKPPTSEPKKPFTGAGFGGGAFGGPGAGGFGAPKSGGTSTFGGGGIGTAGFFRPPTPKDTPAKRNFHIVTLKYADAGDLANVLRPILDSSKVQLVAEPRTNSLILAGSEIASVEVLELLKALDRPAEKR